MSGDVDKRRGEAIKPDSRQVKRFQRGMAASFRIPSVRTTGTLVAALAAAGSNDGKNGRRKADSRQKVD